MRRPENNRFVPPSLEELFGAPAPVPSAAPSSASLALLQHVVRVFVEPEILVLLSLCGCVWRCAGTRGKRPTKPISSKKAEGQRKQHPKRDTKWGRQEA